MTKPADLVQGTLDLLLLKILALGLQWLGHWPAAADFLRRPPGQRRLLYPAAKLEQNGWITAEWRASENNRRAKFYSLTRLGRRHLQQESANWTRLSDAITQVVRLEKA